ncbi:hypothetical protein ES708_33029 [subsurface metagenome]
MKKLSTLLIVGLLTCLTLTAFASVTKSVYIKFSDGQQLEIKYGNDVIYGIMKGGILSKKGGGQNIRLDESYFKIYGDTVVNNNLVQIWSDTKYKLDLKIKYNSLTPNVATVNEFGKIQWKDEGLAKFKISAFDYVNNTELGNITVEVKVIKLPLVYYETLLEEVIEKFGFPDKETQTYFEWYDKSGFFEGIWYYFGTTDCYGETIKHWSYNKYPYLKLRVMNIFLSAHTQGWDDLY